MQCKYKKEEKKKKKRQHHNAGLRRDEELFFVFVGFHSSAVEVFILWEVALLHCVIGLRRFEAM
jgi:hypothetical protein